MIDNRADTIKIDKEKLENLLNDYDEDCPTKPIGGGNPYHKCVSCGRSVPSINYAVMGHWQSCDYMKDKLLKILLECITRDEQ